MLYHARFPLGTIINKNKNTVLALQLLCIISTLCLKNISIIMCSKNTEWSNWNLLCSSVKVVQQMTPIPCQTADRVNLLVMWIKCLLLDQMVTGSNRIIQHGIWILISSIYCENEIFLSDQIENVFLYRNLQYLAARIRLFSVRSNSKVRLYLEIPVNAQRTSSED